MVNNIIRRYVLLVNNNSFSEVLALSPGELTGTSRKKDHR